MTSQSRGELYRTHINSWDPGSDTAQSLAASGKRVRVSPATYEDVDAYRVAMTASAVRIGQWNPVNPGDLIHHLQAQSAKHRTFLIRDLTGPPGVKKGLVGCVNVTNVVEGRFRSATMGYNAFDPYAGRGLFREGLRLVVDIALREGPCGMDLHRVEANVRPGNIASAATLRSLGFRRERTVRRMLWLADGVDGTTDWRDHDSYAVTREEWPARAYANNDLPTGVLLVSERIERPFVVATAQELGGVLLHSLPLTLGGDLVASTGAPVVWHLAADAIEDTAAYLRERGIGAVYVDDVLAPWARGDTPGAAVKAALSIRHYLT